ncbi:hypothetical protein [Streptomyces sp. NPDC052042]|uniref:hypothetical protein n=1 Tax=Streptomyces sp. NPDC052042 TaxID=3365683 RepID=UPI0037D351B0
MSFPRTTSRAAVRLRIAALVAAPVLALSAACGGDDSADGARKNTPIADVPEAPSTSDTDTSKDEKQPGSRSGGRSEFYDAQMKYVQCMRVKGGYKDFPDPKLSGYLDWVKVEEIASRPGQNEAYKGGRNQVCVPEMQATFALEPERDEQKGYESMLAHAQCMRDNGVSRFTNPTMSGGHAQPGGDPNPASPVLDRDSPSYKKAREACQSKLIDSVEGMQ